MSFKKRTGSALPVSQGESNEHSGGGGGLRRRLSSLSLHIQPGAISSTPAAKWAFQRSNSLSSMGERAGSSLRKWWEWGWSWLLSRKLPFLFFFARDDDDLEMNEANHEEKDQKTHFLRGCHNHHHNNNKDTWFLKVRSEIRKLTNINKDKVGLPKTCRYNSSQEFRRRN